MKQNQSTLSSPAPIKERIQRYEEAAAMSFTPEALYKSVAPKKPPRRHKKSTVTTEEEVVYATLDFSKTPDNSGSRDTVRRNEVESTYIEIAPQRVEKPLSEEQITQLISHNSLVKRYQERIQDLCQIVYGNKNVLQEKIEQIQKNPTMGDNLPWQITTYPQSISKFAGTRVCGIKNSARKRAEGEVTSLSGAVDCYVEAVKYAKECLFLYQNKELRHYEQSMDREAIAKILQRPYHSEMEKEPLSNTEIANLVQEDKTVQRYQSQIKYWCKTVFGKSNILQERTEELLTNPAMGEELSWQLATNPQSFHKYAGVSMCGFKNSTRRHAEAGLSPLIDAVDNYARSIQRAKESIVQTHQTKHEKPKPSFKLYEYMQKQQDLSHSSKVHEHAAENRHEVAETSRHEQQRERDVRPRKVAAPKAIAFAS